MPKSGFLYKVSPGTRRGLGVSQALGGSGESSPQQSSRAHTTDYIKVTSTGAGERQSGTRSSCAEVPRRRGQTYRKVTGDSERGRDAVSCLTPLSLGHAGRGSRDAL